MRDGASSETRVGADDFTLLVSKVKEIIEELLDVHGLIAAAVGVPANAAEAEAMVTELLSRAEMLAFPWGSSTVPEKAEVAAQAQQSGDDSKHQVLRTGEAPSWPSRRRRSFGGPLAGPKDAHERFGQNSAR